MTVVAAPRLLEVAFPTGVDVATAAALFPCETQPERTGTYGREFVHDGHREWVGRHLEREVVEGPRWFVDLGPGVIAVRSNDWARVERRIEREHKQRDVIVGLIVAALREGRQETGRAGTGRRITTWSRRSRNLMMRRLAEYDYAPLFDHDGWVPAMVTLTYPGDWITVAPNAKRCRRQLEELRRRFERKWGHRLVAVWKREFQRRGAPHWHLLMAVPTGEAAIEFRTWLSLTWAAIVAHPDPDERANHERAGSGIDYPAGARILDPVRLARYFAKHGVYAVKDYQNQAPGAWLHDGECEGEGCERCSVDGIGGFWGNWGLKRAVTTVPLAPDTALALARTLRRLARHNRYTVAVHAERTNIKTGVVTERKTTRVVIPTMRGCRGYQLANNAPLLASEVARYLTLVANGHQRTGPPILP